MSDTNTNASFSTIDIQIDPPPPSTTDRIGHGSKLERMDCQLCYQFCCTVLFHLWTVQGHFGRYIS